MLSRKTLGHSLDISPGHFPLDISSDIPPRHTSLVDPLLSMDIDCITLYWLFKLMDKLII